MQADEYRRRALQARQDAARATDPRARMDFECLARSWLALAEQAERLAKRYGVEVGEE